MAGARRVMVEFLGQDRSLGKTIGDVDGKSSKLTATLGKVGKAAALGLGAAFVAGGVALVGMTKNAIEDEAAQRRLALAMRNSVGASDAQVAGVEKWISAQGVALGVTDDELRPAFQRLVQATGDVDEAQRQMGIAMDVSAGTGKSLKVVSEALMKANNGTTASLSKLGLKTKDANGDALTLDQSLKAMSDTFGGQAAASANTLDGKMARLRLIMDETKETIGAKLIPVLSTMGDWLLTKGVPALSAFGGWIQSNIVPALQRMGQWIQTNIVPALQSMGQWIGAHVLPVLQRLGSEGPSIFARIKAAMGPVIATVISVAQNVANKMLPVFEQLVATFRSKVVPTIKLVIDRFIEWWPTISKVVSKLADVGATILGTVLPPLIRFAGYVISNVVPRVLDMVEVMAKIIGKMIAVGGAFVDAVQDVGRFLSGVKDKVGQALSFIGGIPGKAASALGNLGGTLMAAGQSLIQGLIDGVEAKLGALKDKLQSVTKLIPDWKGPMDTDRVLLTPAGEALIEGLIKGIDKKKKPLQSTLEKITDYVAKKGDALASLLDRRQQIVDTFRGMASSVFGQDTATEDSPASVQKLLDFQANQRARAESLNANVGALLGKGLSPAMIQELIDAGAQGMDQIALLATATDSQIADLVANNAATQAALEAAGLKASEALIGAQITQAQQDLVLADTIRDKLRELLEQQDKNTIVQLVLDGKVLHVSLKKLKRESGQKLGLD